MLLPCRLHSAPSSRGVNGLVMASRTTQHTRYQYARSDRGRWPWLTSTGGRLIVGSGFSTRRSSGFGVTGLASSRNRSSAS
jgi:hypothetical protein